MNRPALIELPLPPSVQRLHPSSRSWKMGPCTIIAGREGGRWHMSISCSSRLPRWAEINAARDIVLPADRFFCLPFPPRAFWLNEHDYCLHLWEIRDRWLVEQVVGETSGTFEVPSGIEVDP